MCDVIVMDFVVLMRLDSSYQSVFEMIELRSDERNTLVSKILLLSCS